MTPKLLAAILRSKGMPLDKTTIECYEVENEEKTKSVFSVICRGLVGVLLLGLLGFFAGILTTKWKGTYLVGINFNDGQKSLLEVNEKIYKALIKSKYK